MHTSQVIMAFLNVASNFAEEAVSKYHLECSSEY